MCTSLLFLHFPDSSFNYLNISTVTAVIRDDELGDCLVVPGTIQDDMKKKTSTSAEYRKKIIEYYIQYSPGATWSSLTGGLYYWECPKAVVAAKRFIKKTPGKYVISSHDHKPHVIPLHTI